MYFIEYSLRSTTILRRRRFIAYFKKFEKAAEDVKNLKSKPTDAELLDLYSLFKQGTFGDCNTDRPGMFDLKGKAKWDAWNNRKGMTQEAAQEAYITKVTNLIEIYGL